MKQTRFEISRRGMLLAAAGTLATPAIVGGLARPAAAAAPLLGVSRPSHFRFKVGGFEVTTIYDGAIQLAGPRPIFGENQSDGDVQALAMDNHLPGDKMEISFTPVMVNTGKELVMFDSGNGAGRRPNAGKVAATLASAGYSAEQVDIVVITHCHGDHIGGLMEDGKPLFPNARYVIGQVEYDFWSPKEKAESGPLVNAAKLVQSNVVANAAKMSFLKPDGEVTAGIRAVGAFGHTPGHMGYHVESEGKRFVIWADTTNHFVVSLQRPDWHVRFDMNKDDAVASRKKMLDMVAADKLLATGYHMPFPAVGYVVKHGSGYRWVPAGYEIML